MVGFWRRSDTSRLPPTYPVQQYPIPLDCYKFNYTYIHTHIRVSISYRIAGYCSIRFLLWKKTSPKRQVAAARVKTLPNECRAMTMINAALLRWAFAIYIHKKRLDLVLDKNRTSATRVSLCIFVVSEILLKVQVVKLSYTPKKVANRQIILQILLLLSNSRFSAQSPALYFRSISINIYL